MHQYWYLKSQGNGEQYNNKISLYSQPEITKFEVMNDLKLPENWSYRVYPVSWDSSANYTGFNPQPPPFSLGQQPINYAGIIPQGHPANWTPLPGHAGFNFQKPPFPGRNHSIIQGCSHKVILQLYYRRQPSLFISIPITRVFWKPSRMGWSVGPNGMGK